jgi:hypothetical protein
VWVAKLGVGTVFGIQAAIVTFFVIVLITPVILFGRNDSESVLEDEGSHTVGSLQSEKVI